MTCSNTSFLYSWGAFAATCSWILHDYLVRKHMNCVFLSWESATDEDFLDQLLLFADATEEHLPSAAMKERDHSSRDTMTRRGDAGASIAAVSVSLWGAGWRLPGGLREQTAPVILTFPLCCGRQLTVTLKNRRGSAGTSGRPHRGRGRSDWVKDHGKLCPVFVS